MTSQTPPHQGRAPHLYDEQLQRQHQEKMLILRAGSERPDLLTDTIQSPVATGAR